MEGLTWSSMTGLHKDGNSFGQDAKAYFRALGQTHRNFYNQGMLVHTLEEDVDNVAKEGTGEFKRVLGPFDVVNIGIGIILGAGAQSVVR